MALSKTYTAKLVANLIRGIVRELGNKVLQPEEILEYINLAQQIVYNGMDKTRYQTSGSFPITANVIDLSAQKIRQVIKIKDAANGVYFEETNANLFELIGCDPNKKSIYYQLVGEKIEIQPKDNTLDANATVYYIREITPITAETEYLDVPDGEVPKVLEIAEQTVRRQLGKVVA